MSQVYEIKIHYAGRHIKQRGKNRATQYPCIDANAL